MPNCQHYPARRAQNAREFFRVVSLDQFGHELNVTTGTEGPPLAVDHHDPHVWIAACFFQRFSEISTHVTDEGVKTIGPVECDRDDAVVFGDFDQVVVHKS